MTDRRIPEGFVEIGVKPEPERVGPIDYRINFRRVSGPATYTFLHTGAWSRPHNKKRRPVRRAVVKRCH